MQPSTLLRDTMKYTAPLLLGVEWSGPVALLDLDSSDPPLGLKLRRR